MVGPGRSLPAIPRRSPRFRGLRAEAVRAALGEDDAQGDRG